MKIDALLLFIVMMNASLDAYLRIYSDSRNRIMIFFSLTGESPPKLFFENYKQYRKQRAKYNGMDYRYNSTTLESERIQEMSKIREFFRKKEMINVLSHPSVPNETKLRLIDDSRKNLAGDVFSGGLMRQWDFDEFMQ